MMTTKTKRKKKPGPKPSGRNENVEQRKLMAAKRAAERDIEIDFSKQDMKRRRKGKRNPQFFLLTYFPAVFYMPFCDNQKHNIKEIDIRIKQGGMKAIAAERGGGKTSIMKGLVIRGLLYGFIHWVAWIESNLDMAKDSLEDIKLMFEYPGAELAADFPEYCTPIAKLEGQAMRTKSMTYGMERLGGWKWEADRIIFPTITVKTPNNTPALGGIIKVFGAETPIRGLVRAGRRPDFVAINDAETEETAKSPTMTEKIRKNLVNAVGGLGGPGKKIGMGMLCTIIRRGCIADHFTDREVYPQWVGERMRLLISEPTNRQLWETYMHTRQTEQRAGDPDCRKAERFYKKNRKLMDAGAKVANRLRFITSAGQDGKPIEISAIQSVFNIIADRGMEYFLCECQNDPPEELSAVSEIRPHIICDKVNGHERAVLPEWTERLTMFIDVHDAKLYWAAVAWKQGFIGYVVAYGVDPVHSPIAGSVTTKDKKKQTELAILDALRVLRKKAEWPIENTGEIWVPDMGLVDAGYKDDAVYAFIRGTAGGIWRAAKGGASRSGSYRTPKPSGTIRGVGSGYHHSYQQSKRIWLVIHDANKWKRRVQDGFITAEVDEPGSLSLFGDDPVEHRAFAEQIVAEAYNTEKMRYEDVKGYRHNHWLDCMAGCCLAAEMVGIKLVPSITQPKAKRKVVRTVAVPDGVKLGQG